MARTFTTPEATLYFTECVPTGNPSDKLTVGGEIRVGGVCINRGHTPANPYLAEIFGDTPTGHAEQRRSMRDILMGRPTKGTFVAVLNPGSAALKEVQRQYADAAEARRRGGEAILRTHLVVNSLRTDLTEEQRMREREKILSAAPKLGVADPQGLISRIFVTDAQGNILGIKGR